jgi:DNA-binding CsgD family transcriptional regulator
MNCSVPKAVEHDDAKISRPSVERAMAIKEVGAAIIHELNGPLTALLLYVADLKQNSDLFLAMDVNGQSLKQVTENALRETERVCRLLQRIADRFEIPLQEETAIAHGREVIRWWSHIQEDGEDVEQPSRVIRELLTPREHEALRLVIEGCTNKEAAMRMQISYRTFEGHRAEVMRKLGAKNAVDLIKLTLQRPETPSTEISSIMGAQA